MMNKVCLISSSHATLRGNIFRIEAFVRRIVMKCWLIQKFLPLYVGNDLPFSQKVITNHLKICKYCQSKYQVYNQNRQNLRSLYTPQVPTYLLENYWDKLSQKLGEKEPKKTIFTSKIFQSILRPAMATAILVTAIFFFHRWGYLQKNTTPKSYNIPPNIAAQIVPFSSISIKPNQQENSIRPKKRFISAEYYLDQVELLPIETIGF